MQLSYNIIAKAGLGQGEFAELVGVSRATVHNWVSGKFTPSVHVAPRVRTQLTLLLAATRLGTLPGDIPKMYKLNVHSRKKYIRAKLADAAKKLRARKLATTKTKTCI